jgi:hypothetical protein
MAEVHTKDIHAGQEQLADNIMAGAGRPQRRDNLGATCTVNHFCLLIY